MIGTVFNLVMMWAMSYLFKDIVVAPRADRPATVPSALAHYGDEFWAQNGCSALFWAPMNYVTFALVPCA